MSGATVRLADAVIVSTGGWTGKLLPELAPLLQPDQKRQRCRDEHRQRGSDAHEPEDGGRPAPGRGAGWGRRLRHGPRLCLPSDRRARRQPEQVS